MAALLLTARFYSGVDLSASDRAAATDVAGRILKAADIDVLWRDCSGTASHGDPASAACLRPPTADEVIVRLIFAPTSRARSRVNGDSLGDAYVDTAAGTGALATVYVDRVSLMASTAGIDAATLVGRVMAHEIGHLLLGTATHRSSGLMRAEWSTPLLQRRLANDWRLSRADAANAREGVVRRTRPVRPIDLSSPAAVPCAAREPPRPAMCPGCPVCPTALPADRMALDLFIEPRF
jgi:hypothetical protein